MSSTEGIDWPTPEGAVVTDTATPEPPTFRQHLRAVISEVYGAGQNALPMEEVIEFGIRQVLAGVPLMTYGELSGQPNPRDAL